MPLLDEIYTSVDSTATTQDVVATADVQDSQDTAKQDDATNVGSATGSGDDSTATSGDDSANAQAVPDDDRAVKVDDGAITPKEPTQEEILSYLNKQLGKNFQSIEEIGKVPQSAAPLTAEETAAANQKKKDDAVKFALNSEVFTTSELQSYNADAAKTARDLAFEKFTADQLRQDASLTKEDIQDRYSTLMYEDSDETDWQRRIAIENENAIADQIMRERHGKVIGVGDLYDRNLAIEQEAKDYKATVEAVVAGVDKTFKHKFSDPSSKKDYELSFNIPEKTISEVKDQILSTEAFKALQAQGLSPEVLRDALALQVKKEIVYANLEHILNEFVKTHSSMRVLEEKALGSGVPVVATGTAIKGSTTVSLLGQAMDDQKKKIQSNY